MDELSIILIALAFIGGMWFGVHLCNSVLDTGKRKARQVEATEQLHVVLDVLKALDTRKRTGGKKRRRK